MLKHIFLAGFQSSLAASIIVTLIRFFYFKGIAFFIWSTCFFCCIFLVYFVFVFINSFEEKYGFSDSKILFIYVSVGFLLGVITQKILFGGSAQQVDIYTALFSMFYGGCGAVSSLHFSSSLIFLYIFCRLGRSVFFC